MSDPTPATQGCQIRREAADPVPTRTNRVFETWPGNLTFTHQDQEPHRAVRERLRAAGHGSVVAGVRAPLVAAVDPGPVGGALLGGREARRCADAAAVRTISTPGTSLDGR